MAGYTRQDTANNIANGNVIDADDLDSEFNAVEDAFQASTGHTHDGTSGGGAPITKVGPAQDIIVGTTTVLPKANNIIDLGSDAAEFKDGWFDGTVYSDTVNIGVNGYTTIEDNEYAVSSGDLTLDVAGDIILDVDGGDVKLQDGGVDYGKLTNRTNQLSIYSGSVESLRLNGADVDVLGTLDVTGNTTVGGTLTVTGNTSISTGNLTVNTGNVSIGGTLGVTGTITGSLSGAVTGNVTGNLTGNVTGNVTGNASTATTWQTARTISLTGDVTGTATGVDGSGNITIATTVAPNQVALGTDTTGNYVASLVAGTGVTLTNNTGEGATPTVAIGQAVGTTSNVTFNDVVVSGNLTVSGSTTTVNTETINLADNQIVLNSNYTGSSPTENGGIEIERGTLANKTLVWDETADKWTVGSETFVAGTFEGAVTGNASTASTLQTARTIALDGDVTGSASFNGGSNISITATVVDDSHNHIISNIDGLQDSLNAKANLSGAYFTGGVTVTSLDVASSQPTIWMYDADEANFAMHVNSNLWYVLNNSSSGVMYVDQSGNFTAAGNVTAYSDERLKSNIVTIPDALEKVKALRGVNFTKDGEASTGVIAQEVQKVIPEVVHEGDEYLSVAYGNLVGVLIEAVKELSAEVEALKAK
jgi:hypothetical protein